MKRSVCSILSLTVLLGACGGAEPTPETPAPPPPPAAPAATATAEAPPAAPIATEAPAAETPPAPPKRSAKDVITAGGTFAFSLADSPDAQKTIDDNCTKKAKKDDAKKKACVKTATDAAPGDGLRFDKDDAGKLRFTNYTTEKGKEVVLIRGTFAIVKDEAGHVTVAPDAKIEGRNASKPVPKEVTLEVPDEQTVIMAGPGGRMVYKKK